MGTVRQPTGHRQAIRILSQQSSKIPDTQRQDLVTPGFSSFPFGFLLQPRSNSVQDTVKAILSKGVENFVKILR